jgi:hypothetical protein
MQNLNTFSIFTGDDKTAYLKVLQASCPGNVDPFTLAGVTQIDVALPNADGTFTHLFLNPGEGEKGGVAIITPEVLGKFSVVIPSDVSDLLNVGEFQNLDVTFTQTVEEEEITFTVRYEGALSVFQRN